MRGRIWSSRGVAVTGNGGLRGYVSRTVEYVTANRGFENQPIGAKDASFNDGSQSSSVVPLTLRANIVFQEQSMRARDAVTKSRPNVRRSG
jgi:hypothetical protein